MANKQYISIIRLFEHCDISVDGDFNLQRAKKQLQAEFGIAQSGFIEVDGYSYARHDVFEEIERPDFHERFEFHKQIWNNPGMLGLLENNQVEISILSDVFAPFTGSERFDAFFSPYFAGPFSYLCRSFLTENLLRDTGLLLASEDFLQAAEREEAFRSIRIYLDETLRLFRNINKDNYTMMRPKMIHWIESDWHPFFDHMPHEFYEIKNDLTTYLINIGVEIQKKHRKDSKLMSGQLVSLKDLPENLRSLILSNHSAYAGSSSGTGGISFGNYFWVGWVIIMVFRALFSDGCNSSKTSNVQYQFINKDRVYTDTSLQRLLNTINAAKKDSAFNTNK